MDERLIKSSCKEELAARLATRANLSARVAYDVLTELREVMVDMLGEGKSVSIPAIVTLRTCVTERGVDVTARVSRSVRRRLNEGRIDSILPTADVL